MLTGRVRSIRIVLSSFGWHVLLSFYPLYPHKVPRARLAVAVKASLTSTQDSRWGCGHGRGGRIIAAGHSRGAQMAALCAVYMEAVAPNAEKVAVMTGTSVCLSHTLSSADARNRWK